MEIDTIVFLPNAKKKCNMLVTRACTQEIQRLNFEAFYRILNVL